MQKQINKILIPVDYSANARRASEFGMQMAEKMEAEVILFHCYHFPMTSSEDMVYIEKMKEGEVEKLNKEMNSIAHKHPNVSISSIVEYGSAVDLIETITKRDNIDLIVMGTKGETNSLDAVLGSVASNTINNVMCSTLVIPNETRDFKIEEIVLATDFKETENSDYFWPLLSVLDKTDASLAIVNVQQVIDLAEVPSKAELKTNHIFANYKHSHHFLESDNVEEALFDFSNIHEADMIVILTKHYSLWQRLWHKSLAKKLVLHSTIPLLIIHKDA